MIRRASLSSPPSDFCLQPSGPSPGLLCLTEDTFSSGKLPASVWCREGTLNLIQQKGNACCPTLGKGHCQRTPCHQLHTLSICTFICGDQRRNLGCEL